jgi:molybdopterin-binding protein
VTSYRISQAAQLLGVSPDTVRRWADSGRLPVTRDSAGRRFIDGEDLARFASSAHEGQEVPPGPGHSARNRVVGIVTRVERDGVMAQVDLQAGPFRFVSLLSREAVDELGLAPGMTAVASVKATNVTVELPS